MKNLKNMYNIMKNSKIKFKFYKNDYKILEALINLILNLLKLNLCFFFLFMIILTNDCKIPFLS